MVCRDEDGKTGFSFADREWPQGWKGTGAARSSVFALKRNLVSNRVEWAQHAAPLQNEDCSFWGGHQEDESSDGVGDIAVACGEGLYCFTADFFNRAYQLRQLRRIIYRNVVGGQEQVDLGRERCDSLNGLDVGVEIRFRPVQTDWSR